MSDFTIYFVFIYEGYWRENEMDDHLILAQMKNKPSQGLSIACEKYGGLVKAICCKILYDRKEDVEECVADTFVALWRNMEEIDLDKGNLKAYLSCIARNTAINRYNKLKRHDTSHMLDMDLPSKQTTEEEYIASIDIDTIESVIKHMEEPDKEIFFRRFFLFQKIKDIASQLKISNKIVENKLYRGKKKLKSELIKRGVTL